MSSKTTGKKHFEHLDAMRGTAFLLVFLGHVLHGSLKESGGLGARIFEYFKQGTIGLDLFFVLSGFLITWITLEEWKKRQGFAWGKFMIRRILRIWPLYFLLVAIGFGLHSYYGASGSAEPLPHLGWFSGFILNFQLAEHGPAFLFPLVILWSISVEEQFYLFWGLVIKFLRKALIPIALVMIVASIIFRWYYADDKDLIYFHSIAVAGDFAIGAIVAAIAMRGGNIFDKLRNAPRLLWLCFYLLFMLTFALHPWLFEHKLSIASERMWYSFLFAGILFEQAFAQNRLIAWGRAGILNHWGKLSYGMYGFHALVIVAVFTLFEGQGWLSQMHAWVTMPLLIFLGTWGISIISWHSFEKSALKLKHKFYPS